MRDDAICPAGASFDPRQFEEIKARHERIHAEMEARRKRFEAASRPPRHLSDGFWSKRRRWEEREASSTSRELEENLLSRELEENLLSRELEEADHAAASQATLPVQPPESEGRLA